MTGVQTCALPISCSPQPTITRAVQQSIINSYLLPWLNYQLKANCSQGNLFDTQITTDSAITFQKNCLQCTNLNLEQAAVNDSIKVYPNPAKEFVNVSGKIGAKYHIKISDSNAKVILEKEFTETTTIETAGFANGIYFYSITEEGIVVKEGKFIK